MLSGSVRVELGNEKVQLVYSRPDFVVRANLVNGGDIDGWRDLNFWGLQSLSWSHVSVDGLLANQINIRNNVAPQRTGGCHAGYRDFAPASDSNLTSFCRACRRGVASLGGASTRVTNLSTVSPWPDFVALLSKS